MSKDKSDDDPTWSRNGVGKAGKGKSKKKCKMSSRSSLRVVSSLIRKKRMADQRRGSNIIRCVTRTVELPSTHQVGEESSKLLFMMAIGLMPKRDNPKDHMPHVVLERLDPIVEAEAKARTRDIIYQLFEERKKESLRRRALEQFSFPRNYVPLPPPRVVPTTTCIPDEVEPVEFVDLVSDDEDLLMSSDEEPQIISDTNRVPFRHPMLQGKTITIVPIPMKPSNQRQRSSSPPKDKIMYSSRQWPQREKSERSGPVFKSIVNNQNAKIFQNFNPQSIKSFMNISPSSTNSTPDSSVNSSQSKFLSSLKSLPIRGFQTRLSMGKNNTNGESSTSEDDYILPEQIITID